MLVLIALLALVTACLVVYTKNQSKNRFRGKFRPSITIYKRDRQGRFSRKDVIWMSEMIKDA